MKFIQKMEASLYQALREECPNVTKKMSGVMRKMYRKRSAFLGQLNGHSEERITGYKSIVAYNKQADKIVVMDQGRVAEIGNHEQLLAKRGKYYELYMTQFAENEI